VSWKDKLKATRDEIKVGTGAIGAADEKQRELQSNKAKKDRLMRKRLGDSYGGSLEFEATGEDVELGSAMHGTDVQYGEADFATSGLSGGNTLKRKTDYNMGGPGSPTISIAGMTSGALDSLMPTASGGTLGTPPGGTPGLANLATGTGGGENKVVELLAKIDRNTSGGEEWGGFQQGIPVDYNAQNITRETQTQATTDTSALTTAIAANTAAIQAGAGTGGEQITLKTLTEALTASLTNVLKPEGEETPEGSFVNFEGGAGEGKPEGTITVTHSDVSHNVELSPLTIVSEGGGFDEEQIRALIDSTVRNMLTSMDIDTSGLAGAPPPTAT